MYKIDCFHLVFSLYPPNIWFLTMPSSLFGHFALKKSFFFKNQIKPRRSKSRSNSTSRSKKVNFQKWWKLVVWHVKSCVLTWELSWSLHTFSNFDNSQDTNFSCNLDTRCEIHPFCHFSPFIRSFSNLKYACLYSNQSLIIYKYSDVTKIST